MKRVVFVAGLDEEPPAVQSDLGWTVVRTDVVYGPGDEVVSPILKMVRALPVVPRIPGGDREFQPIWYEDFDRVVARILERPELTHQTLDVVGPEITTINDLFDRFLRITGRKLPRVPVPIPLVKTPRSAGKRGTRVPLHDLGIQMTPLDRGLELLADAMPEVLPEEGVGALEHKRFWADIRGSKHSAAALMKLFRDRVDDFMPLQFVAEPGAADKIEQGVTLTGSMPLRGHFQVRVEVAEPTHVVFATLEGHPLAGIVEFTSDDTPSGVRFAIDVFMRASNIFDHIFVKTLGGPAESANWRAVVQRIINASGGTSEGVHQEKETLEGERALRLENRVREIVASRW